MQKNRYKAHWHHVTIFNKLYWNVFLKSIKALGKSAYNINPSEVNAFQGCIFFLRATDMHKTLSITFYWRYHTILMCFIPVFLCCTRIPWYGERVARLCIFYGGIIMKSIWPVSFQHLRDSLHLFIYIRVISMLDIGPLKYFLKWITCFHSNLKKNLQDNTQMYMARHYPWTRTPKADI